MRVAVIGGGIFGCTAAIQAKRARHDVDLFEAKDGLLRCATGLNQFRLHEGYHYPRSPETIDECQKTRGAFMFEYCSAMLVRGRHYYAIAKEGSRVTPQQYLDTLNAHKLSYRIASASALINMDEVELVIQAAESWIDVGVLRGMVWDKLRGVNVRLNTKPTPDELKQYDKVIVAAYASTNEVLRMCGLPTETFQYEVCEKLVLRMPPEFEDVGIVVMDGAFCSLDPYGKTGLHVMGHVKHAIHQTNTGYHPNSGPLFRDLNSGVIERPFQSMCDEMIGDGRRFIPALEKAEHIGSMFTHRAVLPDMDASDARPTMVQELDDKVIRIFSGKIGTAVEAAKQAVALMEKTDGKPYEKPSCASGVTCGDGIQRLQPGDADPSEQAQAEAQAA